MSLLIPIQRDLSGGVELTGDSELRGMGHIGDVYGDRRAGSFHHGSYAFAMTADV